MIKTATQCRVSNPPHGHGPQGVAAYHTRVTKILAGPQPGDQVQRGSRRSRRGHRAQPVRGTARWRLASSKVYPGSTNGAPG
jgi:hypothetical protein